MNTEQFNVHTIKTFRHGDERLEENIHEHINICLMNIERHLLEDVDESILSMSHGSIRIHSVVIEVNPEHKLKLFQHSKKPLYIPWLLPKKYMAYTCGYTVTVEYEVETSVNRLKLLTPTVYNKLIYNTGVNNYKLSNYTIGYISRTIESYL